MGRQTSSIRPSICCAFGLRSSVPSTDSLYPPSRLIYQQIPGRLRTHVPVFQTNGSSPKLVLQSLRFPSGPLVVERPRIWPIDNRIAASHSRPDHSQRITKVGAAASSEN